MLSRSSFTKSVSESQITNEELATQFRIVMSSKTSAISSDRNSKSRVRGAKCENALRAPRRTVIGSQIVYDIPEEESEWNDEDEVSPTQLDLE